MGLILRFGWCPTTLVDGAITMAWPPLVDMDVDVDLLDGGALLGFALCGNSGKNSRGNARRSMPMRRPHLRAVVPRSGRADGSRPYTLGRSTAGCGPVALQPLFAGRQSFVGCETAASRLPVANGARGAAFDHGNRAELDHECRKNPVSRRSGIPIHTRGRHQSSRQTNT